MKYRTNKELQTAIYQGRRMKFIYHDYTMPFSSERRNYGYCQIIKLTHDHGSIWKVMFFHFDTNKIVESWVNRRAVSIDENAEYEDRMEQDKISEARWAAEEAEAKRVNRCITESFEPSMTF